MSKTLRYTSATGAVFAFAYALLFLLGADSADAYVEEDGIVETIGALGLFATSVLFALALFRAHRDGTQGYVWQGALLLLAVAFFFGGGEEISWGQRIFGVETPAALQEVNAQDELNFHNLDTLNGWLNVDRLFQVFWVAFGVLLPVAAALSARIQALLSPLLPILPLGVAAALVGNQLLAELVSLAEAADLWSYSGAVVFEQARFEVTEMLVALIFAAGALALSRERRDVESKGLAGPGAVPASSPAEGTSK